MAENVVTETIKGATAAPKEAFKWARSHIAAAIFFAAFILFFVAAMIESRQPGWIVRQAARIPFLGKYITNPAPLPGLRSVA